MPRAVLNETFDNGDTLGARPRAPWVARPRAPAMGVAMADFNHAHRIAAC